MIEATLAPKARSLGVQAPALALVRRVTVQPIVGTSAEDNPAMASALEGDAGDRITRGAPFPADAIDPTGAWGPDGRTLHGAGTSPVQRWTNVTRACLVAAVEAGQPLFVQDADRLLAPSHLWVGGDSDDIRLSRGDRLLCRLAADGAQMAPDQRIHADTTRLLLIAPEQCDDDTCRDARRVYPRHSVDAGNLS